MRVPDFARYAENVRRMRSAAGALVKHAAGGFRTTRPDTLQARKEICLACEWWNPAGFAGTGQCRKCGCSIAKLHMPAQRCPIGRWLEEPADDLTTL
jgi:hypothetical protein